MVEAAGSGIRANPAQSRSRPCDTCRTRKTRCVRQKDQPRCVLCSFHNQSCTFLKGPTPRARRLNSVVERDDVRRNVHASNPSHTGNHGASPSSPTDVNEEGSSSASPSTDLGIVGSELQSNKHRTELTQIYADSDAHRPKILSNTLGLDLRTHAEYVGPTECRDAVLLDLHHSQRLASGEKEMSSFPRRLDTRTAFIVHPDESTASEKRRIADLDAIEATVSPLGRTLVDLFFRIVHPSFPILHKDVFISKHRVSHRHFAPSLLAAVYLVALDWQIYDSSLAGRETELIPDAAALEELAERTITQDMLRPKLSTLEAGLLLLQRKFSLVEHSCRPRLTSNRMFTAQLVAMAQDIGIHIDCSSWSIPPWEIGLRRRLAWALYMQDRWGACVFGRPFLINHSDWSVQMCVNSDYPELETAAEDVAINVGWELFKRHIELSLILSDTISNFCTSNATRVGGSLDSMGIVAAMDLAKPIVLQLREWYAGLPSCLSLDNTDFREPCPNGGLHLAYHAVEISLYRAIVHAMTSDVPDALHDALRSTSRAKVQAAIDLLRSLRPEHTAAFWGSAAAYQAAQVGSLCGLLWATANTSEEMAWCTARIEDLRWALRVRGAAAPFAREALRLLEREVGGVGMISAITV